mgnify:CR=1 FL=1
MSRILGFFSEKTTDTGTDLTTKGDIHGYSDTNTRVPIGSNDQVLTADSSVALGLKWAAASSGALEVLDYNIVGSSGSTWTSATFSANMKTTYSELILIANLYAPASETEFGDTYVNLNGTTSGYNDAFGFYYDGSSNTNLSKSTSTVGFVTDGNLDLSAGEGMHVETIIAQNDDTTNIMNYHSYSTSSTGVSMILDTFMDIGSTDTITTLKLQASLGNWNVGSNMAIFGRKFT